MISQNMSRNNLFRKFEQPAGHMFRRFFSLDLSTKSYYNFFGTISYYFTRISQA